MKTFADIIADLASGEANELITDQLAEVVQDVEEFGADGTITVQLKIKHHRSGTCIVQLGNVNVKKPQRPTAAEPFFYDQTNVGGLTKDDQRSLQPSLPGANGNVTPIDTSTKNKAN